MIFRYTFGQPFPTEAVVEGDVIFGEVKADENGFAFTAKLGERDRIYGLGENVRGINKRGFEYISDASDNPFHFEDTRSLYGAHNFILVCGERNVGLFFDYPARLVFDLGYTRQDTIKVYCGDANLDVYMIEAETAGEVVKQFRRIIGRSYIAPKFAFGYGQSRWGYKSAEDFREVARKHREAGIPLDMLYMDIDYMDHYKDFTVNPEEFPDFPAYVQSMKEDHIQLIPIIDAGVKVEEGYDVYDEGVEKGFFCKYEDGRDFTACVWPGYTHFPDVLNPKAREWFGNQYRKMTEAGIEGFWNDMCEPAIFHTPEGMKEVVDYLKDELKARNVKFYDFSYLNPERLTSVDSTLNIVNHDILYIPEANSKESMKKMFPCLKCTTFDLGSEQAKTGKTAVLGYPEWVLYTSDFMDYYYDMNVYIFSKFYINPFDENVKSFNNNFRYWFAKEPMSLTPRYANLGYDIGKYFLAAVRKHGRNFEENLASFTKETLQSMMSFKRDGDGFINKGLYLVHFTPASQIEKYEIK